jgi:hypothetical protein
MIGGRSVCVLFALLLLSVVPARAGAPDFDDALSGPRQQLSVVAGFQGDVAFAQPVRGVSQTGGETRTPVSGSGWVTSVSGYVLLPRDQHILRAQIVSGHADPVRTEVLATLDYVLVAVTPQGCYYALSLDGLPARIDNLGDFSVVVLRDAADTASAGAEMTAMLNLVQTAR